jgi:hypothetical protein
MSQKGGNNMKRILLFLSMFIATSAPLAMAAQEDNVAFQKIIDLPGASTQQILDKVRAWSGRYGTSYNLDANSGVVVTNGEIAYPSPSIDRIQYTFVFKMSNKVQGTKDMVTFEKVSMKSPTTYLPDDTATGPTSISGKEEAIKSTKDVAAEKNVLNYLADNLGDFLLNQSVTTCPLEKCPECGVLYPSSDEMKEHLKGHGAHKTM